MTPDEFEAELNRLVSLLAQRPQLSEVVAPSAPQPAWLRCVESISWKLAVGQYHVSHALAAIPSTVSHATAFCTAGLEMMGDEEAVPFLEAVFVCEAHAIAAAHTLHSLGDILAQLVYLTLELDKALPTPIRQGRRHLRSVLEAAEQSNVAQPVPEALRRIINSTTFKYLRAYVNTTQHISLVDCTFAVGLAGDERHRYGLMIQPFRYEVSGDIIQDWPRKWLEDFLRESFDFVSASATLVVRALSTALGSPPA